MLNGIPSVLNITYVSSWNAGVPNATAVAVANIPQSTSGVPNDYTLTLRNISLNGGVWIAAANGTPQFIPNAQILSVTAT
jgi:hypothetical protein